MFWLFFNKFQMIIFHPFYFSILIVYIYHYCPTHWMAFHVKTSTSIRSYTKYNNCDIYNIAGKYINIYQIVCYYIGNNIVEIVSSHLWSYNHVWEFPGNYHVFTVVMLIYHCVERIWRILVTPIFIYNIYDH